MSRKIDLDTWARKDHFEFFGKFDEPFWSATVNVDCTVAYEKAKQLGVSFFLYYLHCSLAAVNQLEEFRYRIVGEEVFLFDDVHASATINRPDGTFAFSYIVYKNDLQEFIAGANEEIARVQTSTGLFPPYLSENVVHYSAIPWVNFTGLTHARSFGYRESNPKISFGKITEVDGRRIMPVSVTVHHALVDGYHVGQYVDLFQQLLNKA